MGTGACAAINSSSAGSVVHATPDTTNASYIDLLSLGTGSTSDYNVSASITDTEGSQYPWFLANPSFDANADNMSGGESSSSTVSDLYLYDATYAPNGNVSTSRDSVMGTWNYTYDGVDRLTSATETAAGSSPNYNGMIGCWTYDAFGNRIMESISTTPCSANPTPQVLNVFNTANQIVNSTLTSNTLTGVGTFTYDSSGNTLFDGRNRYWFDAEGQLCAVQNQASGTTTQYIYDPGGARIAEGTLTSPPSPYTATCTPYPNSGFSLTKRFLVGLGGEQVTELSESGSESWTHSNVFIGGRLSATYTASGVHFELADPLGTKRVQVSAQVTSGIVSAVVDNTWTSLPFGNDINNPISYSTPDATEQHFTQKERDSESGNDYFFARYYTSALGRFTSPDWSAKEEPVPYAVLADPQSLNLYSYVRNNPTIRVDENGHCDWHDLRCQQNEEFAALHYEPQEDSHLTEIKYDKAKQHKTKQSKKKQPEGLPESGVASIYSDWFDGKKTASGEVFSQDGYTAALLPKKRWHAVPLKTRVKITHDGKSVVVEVNDRGAGARNGSMTRVLDITHAAARDLTGQEIWDDEDSNRVGVISITITPVSDTTPLGPVTSPEQK